MKTIKVSEASGAVLDWLVAKVEGLEFDEDNKPIWFAASAQANEAPRVPFQPSTDWAQGGPIIERERICLRDTGEDTDLMWAADDQREASVYYHGAAPLIAAMRCYVASKLGETAEVPEELT